MRTDFRRKCMRVDQSKLDRVRRLLGVRSDSDAVDQALDQLLLREELTRGVRSIAGSGGVENFFN